MSSTSNGNKDPAVDINNPWPGLASYGETDAPFFRGREAVTNSLSDLVASQRVTVLFGLSGLGKTSLLCAGLFPRLRKQGGWPVRIRIGFDAAQPKPVEQVKQLIALEAAATGVEAPNWKESETLWELFHRKDADFWSSRNRPLLPVLVFDQFEELFTLGSRTAAPDGAISRFIDELAALTEGRAPAQVRERLEESPKEARTFRFNEHAYRIVISLREDFLPELESLKSRLPSIAFNRLRLLPMSGADALRVVAQAERLVSGTVAERIVRFVAAAEGRSAGTPLEQLSVEPTLLSVMCRELNKLRKDKGQEKITTDLLTGHREQILSGFYERAVRQFPLKVREFIEDRLLTVSGLRDSFALENIVDADGILRDTIDALVAQRLLRIEERGGVKRVELAHDVLTGVIRDSRDRRRLQESLDKVRKAEKTPLPESVDPKDWARPDEDIEDGWALCLSGGGYRGLLFHTGALWRLNEVGFLPRLERLTAVSAGSIVAAVLGSNWDKLGFDDATGVARNFDEMVVAPLRQLAQETLDVGTIVSGIIGVAGHSLEKALSRRLFGSKTLQDLPHRPRVIIAATNLQSGVLWRFSKPYMRDWRVGEVKLPTVRLAAAVAASTASPPIPPVVLELNEESYTPGSGADLQYPPFTTHVHLVDGAIYDNLALETAWMRYRNILVSDAGGGLRPDPEPRIGFLQGIPRLIELIVATTQSLRKRQLIASYATGERGGAYWGIHSHIKDYSLESALPCPSEKTDALASIPARLKGIEPTTQERLINWGYAVCDASLRRHVELDLASPDRFPYPEVGVG